jgi:hypothetical protein
MNWTKALDSLWFSFKEDQRNRLRDMFYIAQDEPP